MDKNRKEDCSSEQLQMSRKERRLVTVSTLTHNPGDARKYLFNICYLVKTLQNPQSKALEPCTALLNAV